MRVLIVSVRHESDRYVDSIWVRNENAVKRMEELLASLQRSGKRTGTNEAWNIWISEGCVADARSES